MSDANLLIDKLKKANQKKSLDIFLPTLGKEVKFAPLTLKQQKDLLSKIPNDRDGLVKFNNDYNNIVLSNNEENLKLKDIKNIDKSAIVLQYKISMTGSSYQVGKKTVSLNKLSEKIRKHDYSFFKELTNIEEDNISATLSCPDLNYDNKINTAIYSIIQKKKNSVADLFVGEILKYVKSLSIENENLNFYELDYDVKVSLLDELPYSFTKKIVNYSETVKKEESDIFSINNVFVDLTNDLFA